MHGRYLLAGLLTCLLVAFSTAALAEQNGADSDRSKNYSAESDAHFEWSGGNAGSHFSWSGKDKIPTSVDSPNERSGLGTDKARLQQQARSALHTSALAAAKPLVATAYDNHTEGSARAWGADNGLETCGCEKQAALAKEVAGAHQGVFYNNHFDYLCDACFDHWYLGDGLKRQSVGHYFTYDVGGQYRLRFHNEQNIRGLGLTGRDDTFLLQRTRLYTNVEIGSRLRFYGEMIDAESELETLAPRPIEENRVDLLNLFMDFMLYDGYRGDLWARVGRQELLYGAQRLISPLDWANTRRTFDGYKLMWKGTNWDIDGFWVRPVFETTTNSKSLNNPDQSQEYMGFYSTYKGFEKETLDLYFTRYIETDGLGFEFNTFGGRWTGSHGAWLWDIEAAVQYGDVNGVNNDAGFYTIGLGRKMESLGWQPTFWAYFDWASGEDAGPAGSAPTGRGYHHQFPLSHKYLGFMDLFGRRNIEDLNFLFTANPCPKLKLLAWWHIFHLQDGDVPYNVVMGPSATINGGDAFLGQELDLVASWNYSPRHNLLLGYSHFFAGDFYRTNGSPGLFDGDADFYYTQLTFDF